MLPDALEAAERALGIEDNSEARLVRGYVRMALGWDAEAGLLEFDRVIERNPNLSIAYVYRSLTNLISRSSGGLAPALRDAEKAVELEPLAPINRFVLAFLQVSADRMDDAIETERGLQALAPGFIYIESPGAVALRAQGRFDEALEMYETAAEAQPDEVFAGRAVTLAQMGRRSEAEALLPLVEARAVSPYAPRVMVAAVHASLGNVEEMFEWLERGFVDHDSWLWWIPTLPVFDPHREDPRMVDLLLRIGMGG